MPTTQTRPLIMQTRTSETDLNDGANRPVAEDERQPGDVVATTAARSNALSPGLVLLARGLGRAAARQAMARHRGQGLIEVAVITAALALLLMFLMARAAP